VRDRIPAPDPTWDTTLEMSKPMVRAVRTRGLEQRAECHASGHPTFVRTQFCWVAVSQDVARGEQILRSVEEMSTLARAVPCKGFIRGQGRIELLVSGTGTSALHVTLRGEVQGRAST